MRIVYDQATGVVVRTTSDDVTDRLASTERVVMVANDYVRRFTSFDECLLTIPQLSR